MARHYHSLHRLCTFWNDTPVLKKAIDIPGRSSSLRDLGDLVLKIGGQRYEPNGVSLEPLRCGQSSYTRQVSDPISDNKKQETRSTDPAIETVSGRSSSVGPSVRRSASSRSPRQWTLSSCRWSCVAIRTSQLKPKPLITGALHSMNDTLARETPKIFTCRATAPILARYCLC